MARSPSTGEGGHEGRISLCPVFGPVRTKWSRAMENPSESRKELFSDGNRRGGCLFPSIWKGRCLFPIEGNASMAEALKKRPGRIPQDALGSVAMIAVRELDPLIVFTSGESRQGGGVERRPREGPP